MAPSTSESLSSIDSLLQQRAQFEQWLARLDSASDKAPPAVRQRVRSDYEGRLKGVIEELRGHSATIGEELERHRASQAELDRERRLAEEALAEAEVRHTVGEFTEEEWTRINDESQANLTRLREGLGNVGSEISRLAEVQALITAEPKRAEPPAPPPPPASPPKAEIPEPEPELIIEPELEIERETPPPTPSPAPAARPTPSPRREPAAAPPGDELAFLKSVSEEERKPAARRPSNPGGGHTASRVSESAAPASQAGTSGRIATPTGAKTLKCGECGTLNRPTEWYCERCGAELAGL
ncbi:MAG: zinc finger Ran-binding domain-containing protein [Gemmatimonadales bacterium]